MIGPGLEEAMIEGLKEATTKESDPQSGSFQWNFLFTFEIQRR